MADNKEVALLQDVDIHPVSLRLQHVVFRHVDMEQSIEVPVGVEFIGEAPADSISGVFVVYELDIVRVRCLPDDIPHAVTVDVSELESPGDAVRIGNLESIDRVEYVDDIEVPLAVVHIERLEEEEEEIEEGLLDMVSDAEGEEEDSADTPSEGAGDA
jgi:large subunit ribosomal protein L25